MNRRFAFRLLAPDEIPWDTIQLAEDSTIYKSREWFSYLKQWKNINPFICEVIDSNELVGYFIGEEIKKILTIIGSPFEGIGTAHQGLSSVEAMHGGCYRISIYDQFAKWVFRNRYASYVQIDDWFLTLKDCDEYGKKYQAIKGYRINLEKDENELYHNLHQKSCRYSINKSIRKGVLIRESPDSERFIDVYYNQLIEVFHKQGLKPTYNKQCVQSLVDALYPKRILLLEAITGDGEIIATGIFPGDKNIAVFWGGASFQNYQSYCPNEPLIWEAIKIWKQRGTHYFDMCGIRPYKLKFGPEEYFTPRLVYAKYKVIPFLKETAKKLYYLGRSVLSRIPRR